MANLLPPRERARTIRLFYERGMLAFSGALILAALLAIASLIPALVSVHLALANIPEEPELSPGAREDQAHHARALALATAIKPVIGATTTPSASVTAALTAKPPRVSVTSVSYTKGKVVVSGTSQDRQAVNQYREALEADAQFTAVSVPVAALVGAQDGRFTITLSGKF